MIVGLLGLAGSGKDTVAKYLADDLNFVGVAFADPLKQIAKTVYRFTDDQLWGPSYLRNAPDERWPRPKHSYVDSQKGMTCVCCGYLHTAIEKVPEAQCYLTPRYALQLLGTEWGRECYPDTWAVMGLQTAQDLLGPHGHNLRYDRTQGLIHLPDTRDSAEADRREEEKPQGVAITDVRFKNEVRVLREKGAKVVRIRRPGAGLGAGAGTHPSEAEQASIPDSEFDAIIENDSSFDALRAKAHEVVRLLRSN